jgi:hypothetical protein
MGISLIFMDRGKEKYQYHPNKNYYEYYYRHLDGDLFACFERTLEECRILKNEWIENTEQREKTFLNSLENQRLNRLKQIGGINETKSTVIAE